MAGTGPQQRTERAVLRPGTSRCATTYDLSPLHLLTYHTNTHSQYLEQVLITSLKRQTAPEIFPDLKA
ncbi:hypothetical protein EVAR_51340_1 [Eumeta japonica]|uniref:Uncharacterized protein n=1 Tax=Eumeta variegata TaxID=151549 RepID=A0A4C1XX14_EUMVA|nr:hypothetical protein EVAR_51340_1 [Eumeta japonica]